MGNEFINGDVNPLNLKKSEMEKLHNKIIIPKEEPKKETLEEAGVVAVGLCEHLEAKEQAMFISGFQECAKWQQEQDKNKYSEEDMKEAYKKGYINGQIDATTI